VNILNLKEKGFSESYLLKGLQFTAIPQDKNAIIILSDSTATNPATDILYIGKTKKPARRIFGGFLAGYGGKTTRKIHSMLIDDGLIEKVSICWMTTENAKTSQQALLKDFKKEHGQYPKWNALKKPQPAPKTKVAKIAKVTVAAKNRKPKLK
jgi:hypothetical protein